MQPLLGPPELLPEIGVLANHSSDFSPAKRTQSTQTNRPGYGGRTIKKLFCTGIVPYMATLGAFFSVNLYS